MSALGSLQSVQRAERWRGLVRFRVSVSQSVSWWRVSNPTTVGELIAIVCKIVSARCLHTEKVATVKVHATDAMAEDNNVCCADKIGNGVADIVADFGRGMQEGSSRRRY